METHCFLQPVMRSAATMREFPVSAERFITLAHDSNFLSSKEYVEKHGAPLYLREYRGRALVGTMYLDARDVIAIAGGRRHITFRNRDDVYIDVIRGRDIITIRKVDIQDGAHMERGSVHISHAELEFLSDELKKYLDKLGVKW